MTRVTTMLTVPAVFAGLFLLVACSEGTAGPDPDDGTRTTASSDETFTPDELARYDGVDGRPAYVAVDGVVYDVSDSSLWPDGAHSPCSLGALAGKDLSSVMTQAPANMRSLLSSMPVVGRLEQ